MAYRFTTDKPEGGNLTPDNVNSLDAGLNVYTSPAGGLAVRVSPGVYWSTLGGERVLVEHAGQTSDLTITGSATRYVYVSSAGTITAAAALPSTPHIPLARVVSGVATITSITDLRTRLADLADGSPSPASIYLVGNYYASNGGRLGTTTVSLTADTLYAVPFSVEQTLTADRIAAEVTTLHASDIRLGIYAEGATPGSPDGGALVHDAGVIAAGTTGVKAIAIGTPVVLPPGRYYLAIIAANATTALRAIAASAATPNGISASDFSASAGIRWKAGDGLHDEASALPSTFPATPTLQNTAAPVLAIRAA